MTDGYERYDLTQGSITSFVFQIETVGLLTLPNDPVVLYKKHLSGNKNILHLLQQLWPKTGDGDLLCRHEGSEGRIYAACSVGPGGEHHRPHQRGGWTQGYYW